MSHLRDQIFNCKRCRLRSGCETVVVPGEGSSSRLIVVGESPREADELVAEPFRDRGGRWLWKQLESAGISKRDVWATYAVKCRGDITEESVLECKGWLWKEIQSVKPKVILTLGKLPTRLLLLKKASLRLIDVVGQFHKMPYMSSLVAPWYDAEFLLSSGQSTDEATLKFFKQIKELL